MPVNTIELIAKLKPRLIKKATLMRDGGKSFDDIARFLTTSTGHPVGREAARRWFKSEAEKMEQ